MGNKHGNNSRQRQEQEQQRRNLETEMRNLQSQITQNTVTIDRLTKELIKLKQRQAVLLSSVNKKSLTDINAGIESIKKNINDVLNAIAEKRKNNDTLSAKITEIQHIIDDQIIQIKALTDAVESGKIEIGSLINSIGVSSTHTTDLKKYDSSIKHNVEPLVSGITYDNLLPIEKDTVNVKYDTYGNIKLQNEYVHVNADIMKKKNHTSDEKVYYEEQTNNIYNYLNVALLMIYYILYCIFIYIFISRGTVVANLDIIICMFLFPFFISIAITFWSYFF